MELERVKNVPSLERPLYLLTFFTRERPQWALTELARASELPKVSCLRLIRVLEKYSMLVREGDLYRLGPRLLSLGSQVQEGYPPRRVALPYLIDLRDTTGQSAQWVIRDGYEGVYLEVIEAQVRVRLFIAPGRRAPLHAGSSTRLLLSFAPTVVQDAILASDLRTYTPITPDTPAKLRPLLDLTRETWLAASFGELTPQSAELAAPVLDASGEVIAAVSVAGTAQTYRNTDLLLDHLDALSTATQAISRAQGYAGEWHADPKAFVHHLIQSGGLPSGEKGAL